MDQIITLLTNLFNLTKVASVTLPGVALAGALALFLWPPRPVDTVRIPVVVHSAADLSRPQQPCSNLPVLERGNSVKPCEQGESQSPRLGPACILTSVNLSLVEKEKIFKQTGVTQTLCSLLKDNSQGPTESNPGMRKQIRDWCRDNIRRVQKVRGSSSIKPNIATVCDQAAEESNEKSDRELRESVETLCNAWKWDSEVSLALANLFKGVETQQTNTQFVVVDDIEQAKKSINEVATGNHQHPWEGKVLKQFVLDKTKDRLAQCNELEMAWQGQEQADNDQLKLDIGNLDKQRSDLQDAYIASLKTNDRILSENFRRKLSGILELSDEYRERFGVNLMSINERTRRLDEIKREQANVDAMLAAPGSLRAIQGFDVYIQGLVNHVVALVLLSIALSLILVAFDRSVLGNLFESLFPGW